MSWSERLKTTDPISPLCVCVCLVSTDCNCNPFGSDTDRCNGTGYCKCKEGTTGAKCHECLQGYLWDNGCKSRVCDNELLRCQNGGVCVNNIRCQCPPAYTGLLCEKPRCENEPGGCGGSDSGQASLRPPVPMLLLLLFVLGPVLLMEICWVTVLWEADLWLSSFFCMSSAPDPPTLGRPCGMCPNIKAKFQRMTDKI